MYGEDFFIGAQEDATNKLFGAGLSTKGAVTEGGSRVFDTNRARTEEQERSSKKFRQREKDLVNSAINIKKQLLI